MGLLKVGKFIFWFAICLNQMHDQIKQQPLLNWVIIHIDISEIMRQKFRLS